MPYPELYIALFEGISASGSNRWTSTQTTSGVGSSSHTRVQTLQITDNAFDDMEDDDGTSHQTGGATPDPSSPSDAPPSVERPRKKAKASNPTPPISMDQLALDVHNALQHLVKGKDGPTVDECYQRLKLVGLDPSDPLFVAAFQIFGTSADMREAWMTLPAIPELQQTWIERTATSLGFPPK